MKKVLVCGDIHGRKFWKKPCENIENYDKVIFLGDYFDPYGFEDIEITDCIENFKEIIELKKNNNDKVVLLLGNHDMPYFSKTYFGFSWYHCRHSMIYHNGISKLFKENKELFQIAYTIDDILFTHAGVDSGWLKNVVKYDDDININKICHILNHLLDDKKGLEKLYYITRERGGRDRYGSCIWADVHDIMWDNENGELNNIKQIFGHTIQAFYDINRNIVFGDAVEFGNCKMVDTAKPYELDVETFEIGDYFECPIPKNSLIYCDPPYCGTKQYMTSKDFDYDMFYDWCRAMKEDGHTIFVSEYNMPSDFKCVWEKEVTNAMNPTITKKPVEKLFTL